MAIYWTMNFLRNPKELIQSSTYEKIILQIMNESAYIFPEKYEGVIDQAHGEPDIVSSSGIQFDAKLLFSNEQCHLLSKGIKELYAWIVSVQQELGAASRTFISGNNMRETSLYNEMLSRLPAENVEENTIYFTPYPIVLSYENSVFGQFASDIISTVYGALLESHPESFFNKACYIIYPSVIDNKIVLRKLGSHSKEFVSISPLSSYVTYAIESHPDIDADVILY